MDFDRIVAVIGEGPHAERLGAQRFAMAGSKLTAAGWRDAGLDPVGSFLAN